MIKVIEQLDAAHEYAMSRLCIYNEDMFKFHYKAYLSTMQDMAMEPNNFADEIAKLKRNNIDLADKLNYLLNYHIEGEDGKFCFPDGNIWKCQKIGELSDGT